MKIQDVEVRHHCMGEPVILQKLILKGELSLNGELVLNGELGLHSRLVAWWAPRARRKRSPGEAANCSESTLTLESALHLTKSPLGRSLELLVVHPLIGERLVLEKSALGRSVELREVGLLLGGRLVLEEERPKEGP